MLDVSFHTLSGRIKEISIQIFDETILQIVLWQLGFTVLDYAFTHKLAGTNAGKETVTDPLTSLELIYLLGIEQQADLNLFDFKLDNEAKIISKLEDSQ